MNKGFERRRVTRALWGGFAALAVVGVIAAVIVSRATAAEPITLDIIAAGPVDAETFKCPGAVTDVIDPADCTVRVPVSPERFPDADAVFPVNLFDATDETFANFWDAGPHAGVVLCGNYDNPGPSYFSAQSLGTAPHGEQVALSTTPPEELPALGYAVSGQFDIGRGEGCHVWWGVYHFSFYGPPGTAAIEGAEAGELDWSTGMFLTFDPARGALTTFNTVDYANIVTTFDETVPVSYEEWTLADWVERWTVAPPDPQRSLPLSQIWGTTIGSLALIGLIIGGVHVLLRQVAISAETKGDRLQQVLNHAHHPLARGVAALQQWVPELQEGDPEDQAEAMQYVNESVGELETALEEVQKMAEG